MRYEFAEDLQKKAEEISKIIFPHIDITRIKCFRSYGTSSRGTIARCHSLEKLLQRALGIRAFYVLEFLSERFDRLSEEDQIRIIIHELMHIPNGFGGGFKHHNFVNDRNIKKLYLLYKETLKLTSSASSQSEEKTKNIEKSGNFSNSPHFVADTKSEILHNEEKKSWFN